ncbi:MAG: adenosylmethionine--8-amino-7-oxononanoate transaminase [Methylococcales bacterium]
MSTRMNPENILEIDRKHIWHPYSRMDSDLPTYAVKSASGVRLKLADGRELIDGMSSWWCAIHGYNHPVINQAITRQLESMSHVMFGGLTHLPAANLAKMLVDLSPEPLDCVFFADSGSVAVEVAMKMAIQYWSARGQAEKQRFLTVRNGYHGDTFGAMSVCDPVNGMHTLFNTILPKNLFAESPSRKFGEAAKQEDCDEIRQLLEQHSNETAAVIIEPVVQGAGGMRFYSADILKQLRVLCDRYDILLIFDEIATGFGRTGRLFACEHAGIAPDILCVGKALTGGYLPLAATLCTRSVSRTIGEGDPGIFMHGPTFMANPLACAAGVASLKLLLASNWQEKVQRIQSVLEEGLHPCTGLPQVADVRVLGAIGVVELTRPVDLKIVTREFVSDGVWVRPFGKLVYLMPPFIIEDEDLKRLTNSVCRMVQYYCTREAERAIGPAETS